MTIPVEITRYEETIREYEQYPLETGKVLLYGSSFFRHWGYERARTQWKEATDGRLTVVNHGFGGSIVDEQLYYYSRMVRPYRPSAILLRCGINDIFQGFSPQEAWFLTERLIRWAKADDKKVRVGLIGIFDNKSLTDTQYEAVKEYNRISMEYAAGTEHVFYLDINEFFYESPQDIGTRRNFRNVFLEDGLHLTDDAYVKMAEYLAPVVLEQLQEDGKELGEGED